MNYYAPIKKSIEYRYVGRAVSSNFKQNTVNPIFDDANLNFWNTCPKGFKSGVLSTALLPLNTSLHLYTILISLIHFLPNQLWFQKLEHFH